MQPDHRTERSSHTPVATFHLYRIHHRARSVEPAELAESLCNTTALVSAHVDLQARRIVVRYRRAADLQDVEPIARRFGMSTSPTEAVAVMRSWDEFLRNERLGDD